MGYDGANRLVHLTHASASGDTRDATYRYDGLGRRISKTVRHPDGTTATTHYGWDGDRIVREETENQRTTVVYEPGSFVPMLRIEDTQQGQILSAYVTDALGTPMQLVNAHGNTAWQAQPDDWAATQNERGHTTQPIRFQGQWHDKESGLYYNRHRYYDPQQGRYISQDPIGLKGGTNLYGYALGSPTINIDPTGLIAPLVIAAMGLVGAGMGGGANVISQKVIRKECSLDVMELGNAMAWGLVGGAAMPVVGTTIVGAGMVGGAAGVGQYTTGSMISGEEMSMAGAVTNTGMGAIGGGAGGSFTRNIWYGTRGTALPEVAYRQGVQRQIQQNTTPQSIGQGIGGGVIGGTDPTQAPCLGCQPECE
ncbi:RHS domain-containing protein [Vreelandella aquamarina]|uniref:RHS repeat-associated core domain-containing protein n=1 Tax=Vreelandella aquamarina TaxID=77097 RepID=UPI00384C36F2